ELVGLVLIIIRYTLNSLFDLLSSLNSFLKSQQNHTMRPKIYLFGDSITEMSFADGGWGASLTNHFSRKVDVVVRGYSGYNTRWALMAAEKVFPAGGGGAPLAVTVFFGANDACLPDRYGAFQHVPVDEFKNNLRSIASLIKGRWPNAVVLFITPPPIDEESRLKYMDNPSGQPERTNQVAGEYAKGCIDVAKECGCPVIDLWTKMQQSTNWQTSCLSDGLHLTQLGNKIVFEEVVKKLEENGLSPETLPFDLPVFSDVDFKDPLKSFRD
ncbi:GDSL esterase/lipase At5g45920, partial [Linum perenne]